MTKKETGTSYQWTVGKVYDQFPKAANRWVALGQQDSDIHWDYGREVEWLVSRGVPKMIAYTAIGKKAGKSGETIRQAYYTFKTFDDAAREEYHLAPYSVFNHARMWKGDPEDVLNYYIKENGKGTGCSIDEVKAVYPTDTTEGENETVEKMSFPRYLFGAVRQLIGLKPEKKERAEHHLREFVKIVKDA